MAIIPTAAELAASRLPDAPNAGYSTNRQREASDWMNDIARRYERDRPLLLRIVCAGRSEWHKQTKALMRGMLKPTELDTALDSLFNYFVAIAGPNPDQQLEQLALMEKWSPYGKATWTQLPGHGR